MSKGNFVSDHRVHGPDSSDELSEIERAQIYLSAAHETECSKFNRFHTLDMLMKLDSRFDIFYADIVRFSFNMDNTAIERQRME